MNDQIIIPIDYTRDRVRVTVIGCGRWGSFLAWYADKIGHKVTLYGRSGSLSYERLVMSHANEYVKLPSSVALSDNLQRAVGNADIILVSVPSQNFRDVMEEL